MTTRNSKLILTWLVIVAGLIMIMVIFGGYVRLTRSGLSIVEWNPISGVVPPIGETAWEEEFAKYQQTPEYQHINSGMTLAEYKEIFYLEYIHRLIGRFAGLVVAIPLLYMLVRGIIPRRKSPLYVTIGLLFAFQGYMGWYMVSSGLVDRPAVSHLRLTAHLLMAILLLGLVSWAAFNHYYRFPTRKPGALRSLSFGLALLLMAVLIIQIAWGGFMAGLKAGHVSSTWPLMYGRWLPPGMFTLFDSWWQNLISNPTAVHFVHRWFALVVLAAAAVLYASNRKRPGSGPLTMGVATMVGLTLLQISLGVGVIWFLVPITLALTHQGVALLLFLATLFIIYQVVYEPATIAARQSAPAVAAD